MMKIDAGDFFLVEPSEEYAEQMLKASFSIITTK